MRAFRECRQAVKSMIAVSCLLLLTACAHKPPTIAHTHIGHAVTAFDGTPGEKGLFVIAEERARDALRHAEGAASADADLDGIKQQMQEVVEAYRGDEFGVKHAMDEAVKHIEFASTSQDASGNVRNAAEEIRVAADGILNRSDLILLLGNDVMGATSVDEGRLLAQQIRQLAEINVNCDASEQSGVVQVRKMIDEMIASEDPEYVTVDRWYLFHLVRLPDCDTCWAWRKWANSSNRGY